MQHQILIIVMIFFAYALNLPLNTQRPHHRSQRTGKLGLCRRILAHGSRPIYRAPTYIAVPFHGPHQPRYIGLTLYLAFCKLLSGSLAYFVHSGKVRHLLLSSKHYGNQSRGCLMVGRPLRPPACPSLQPGPPSQTPGGVGQRYWSVSRVMWPPKSGVSEVGVFRALQPNVQMVSRIPSNLMALKKIILNLNSNSNSKRSFSLYFQATFQILWSAKCWIINPNQMYRDGKSPSN